MYVRLPSMLLQAEFLPKKPIVALARTLPSKTATRLIAKLTRCAAIKRSHFYVLLAKCWLSLDAILCLFKGLSFRVSSAGG